MVNIRTFPEEIETILLENNIVNGIGGKGGFPIDKFFHDNIIYLDEFLPEKGVILYEDIRRLSIVHDIDFILGISKFDFWLANYRFAKGVYQLLNWTSRTKKLAIFLSLFILLNRHGKIYFNFQYK